MALTGKDGKGLMIEVRYNGKSGEYFIMRRAENYCGGARGGIKFTWRTIVKGLTRAAAISEFSRLDKTGAANGIK